MDNGGFSSQILRFQQFRSSLGKFIHIRSSRYAKLGVQLCTPGKITYCVFFLRKKPPARQIRTAQPPTMTEPTKPDTVVPTALSLSAKP